MYTSYGFKLKTLATLCLGLMATVSTSPLADESNADDTEKNAKRTQISEHIQILGRTDSLRTESGSATLIDELTLDKFKYDDIHRVLANVPGVNIRQEDGYGLRPNIGFRGVTPERSKKINIMEDGILIGPSPYSAPAAYYFPSVSKMTSVEVFKGPSTIKYGPNTVAGSLNMTTRATPDSAEGEIDLSLGSNGYQKFHGYWGDSVAINNNDLGYVIELMNHQADGFKQIDNAENSLFDSDTGFVKNDALVKVNYQFSPTLFSYPTEQYIELKLGSANEDSNETYMGLTDADFAQTPYRRYAVSQVGNMDWQHEQVQLTHNLRTEQFNLTTRAYNNTFSRAWRKVNGFNPTKNPATDRTLQDIIAAPENGINANYYQILTGEKDTESVFEQVVVGTNDRSYYSRGLQADLRFNLTLLELTHNISTGIRFHKDRIDRDHFEQNFLMQSGVMTPSNNGPEFTTVNYESSDATSVYFEDAISYNNWLITLGSRGEFVDSEYQNEVADKQDDWLTKSTRIWLYSASTFYSLNDHAGVFAGVHQGYVPTSPKQAPAVKPETSTNYELGGRYQNGFTKFESVLFFNDFNNLKESCSFSTSASCAASDLIDQEYNGGEVDVYGLELTIENRLEVNGQVDMPWSIVYTNTQSEFKQELVSSFELWGEIQVGDSVPYLPENQLTLNIGLESTRWQLNLLISYTDAMPEAAGDNVALSGLNTDEYTNIDISANYDFNQYGLVYLKVDNIFDEASLVSRRPFGARPSKPQQLFLGYKYQF